MRMACTRTPRRKTASTISQNFTQELRKYDGKTPGRTPKPWAHCAASINSKEKKSEDEEDTYEYTEDKKSSPFCLLASIFASYGGDSSAFSVLASQFFHGGGLQQQEHLDYQRPTCPQSKYQLKYNQPASIVFSKDKESLPFNVQLNFFMWQLRSNSYSRNMKTKDIISWYI